MAEGKSWPNGFSITTRRHRPCVSVTRSGGAKPGDCHAEKAIRDGEVEEIVTCRARCFIQLRQMLVEPAVGLWIVEVTLQIAHAVGKPLPRVLVNTVDLELAFVRR